MENEFTKKWKEKLRKLYAISIDGRTMRYLHTKKEIENLISDYPKLTIKIVKEI